MRLMSARRFWARLAFAEARSSRLKWAAISAVSASIVVGGTALTLKNRYVSDIETLKGQIEQVRSEQDSLAGKASANAEPFAIASKLEEATNPVSHVISRMSALARRHNLRPLGVDVSSAPGDDPDSIWKKKLLRFRIEGPSRGVARWIDDIRRDALVVAPNGINISTKGDSAQPQMIVEFEALMPTADSGSGA